MNWKHGTTAKRKRTRTYVSWVAMRARCRNPGDKDWHNYGGRGITYCAEWEDYAVFLRDMGVRPVGKTLNRKNNNGHYTPANCEWATVYQQNTNRRRTKLTEAAVADIRQRRSQGEPLKAVAARFGVSEATVSMAARSVTWKGL